MPRHRHTFEQIRLVDDMNLGEQGLPSRGSPQCRRRRAWCFRVALAQSPDRRNDLRRFGA
jgi:hypothetical protein